MVTRCRNDRFFKLASGVGPYILGTESWDAQHYRIDVYLRLFSLYVSVSRTIGVAACFGDVTPTADEAEEDDVQTTACDRAVLDYHDLRRVP